MPLHTGDVLYRGRFQCFVEVQPDMLDPQGGVVHLTYLRSGRQHSIPMTLAEKQLSSEPPPKRSKRSKRARP